MRAVEHGTGTALAAGPNAFDDDDDGLTHERDSERPVTRHVLRTGG